jgi:hypothetical protein
VFVCTNRYPGDPRLQYGDFFEEILGPDEVVVGSPRGVQKVIQIYRCRNLLRRYPLSVDELAEDESAPGRSSAMSPSPNVGDSPGG